MTVARGFTRGEGRYLLSADSDAAAFGDVVWTSINGVWRGSVPVSCSWFPEGGLRAEMQVRPRMPSEPTVVYVVRDSHLARVDTNGAHRGRRFSHFQHRQTPEDPEVTEAVPTWFVDVPLVDTVSDGTYARVFRDSCRLLRINTSAVRWIDPPEGGVPR